MGQRDKCRDQQGPTPLRRHETLRCRPPRVALRHPRPPTRLPSHRCTLYNRSAETRQRSPSHQPTPQSDARRVRRQCRCVAFNRSRPRWSSNNRCHRATRHTRPDHGADPRCGIPRETPGGSRKAAVTNGGPSLRIAAYHLCETGSVGRGRYLQSGTPLR